MIHCQTGLFGSPGRNHIFQCYTSPTVQSFSRQTIVSTCVETLSKSILTHSTSLGQWCIKFVNKSDLSASYFLRDKNSQNFNNWINVVFGKLDHPLYELSRSLPHQKTLNIKTNFLFKAVEYSKAYVGHVSASKHSTTL